MQEADTHKYLDIIVTLLTAIGGVAGVGKLIEIYSDSRKRRIEHQIAEDTRIEANRQEYQEQLHEDWEYYRSEVRALEASYRALAKEYQQCERDRMKIEAEILKLREHMQILQLKCDNLEEELAKLSLK